MRIHIYALRFRPHTGGGAHRTLDLMIRALLRHDHDVILTTLLGGNDVSEYPIALDERTYTKGFLSLQWFVAKLMKEDTLSDIHLVASPALLWRAGLFAR